MNRESVLKLYERLASLVEKLPGGMQKPILREIVPIRELFLEQRPARLLVLGGAEEVAVPALLHSVCGAAVETGDSRNGWREYCLADRGAVEVLDGREGMPEALFGEALEASVPDAVLFLRGSSDEPVYFEEAFRMALARLGRCDDMARARPGVVAIACGDDADKERLRALLNSYLELSSRPVQVATDTVPPPELAETICGILPNAARLEFARMTAARDAQVAIASSLLKSFTAVCGVIGVQPIPLADMPILMTLQSLMVGLVVYVSGRKASPRLIAEFAGALGVNIGAGFALREGARALLKIFPVWGNAISGIVAGAGTYAIGRAAIAYFIEDLPLQETKKLFARLQPGIDSFRRRGLMGRRKKNRD